MYVMYYSLLEGMCNDANHNTSCFGVLGWVGACVCGECEWKGAKNDWRRKYLIEGCGFCSFIKTDTFCMLGLGFILCFYSKNTSFSF